MSWTPGFSWYYHLSHSYIGVDGNLDLKLLTRPGSVCYLGQFDISKKSQYGTLAAFHMKNGKILPKVSVVWNSCSCPLFFSIGATLLVLVVPLFFSTGDTLRVFVVPSLSVLVTPYLSLWSLRFQYRTGGATLLILVVPLFSVLVLPYLSLWSL